MIDQAQLNRHLATLQRLGDRIATCSGTGERDGDPKRCNALRAYMVRAHALYVRRCQEYFRQERLDGVA